MKGTLFDNDARQGCAVVINDVFGEPTEDTRAPRLLSLSGNVEDRQLGALCSSVARLHALAPGGLVEIDLRGLKSIGPGSLAMLMAALRALRSRRICEPLEQFTPPAEGGLAASLSRPAMEQLLAGGAGRGYGDGGAAPTPRICEPFTDSGGIDRAVAAFQGSLPAKTVWTESDRASFGTLVSDLAKNVLQHSESDGVAVLRPSERDACVDLAIADAGIGIRRSLARNPDHLDFVDDTEAVRRAVSPSVTGDPGMGGGLGLYLARLVVDRNRGHLVVHSGTASYEEQADVKRLKTMPHLQGTLVAARIHMDRDFDYDQVDSLLERPGGIPG